MADHPDKLDTPDYSPEELSAARAFVRFERARFRQHISYAEAVEFTTTSSFRGDIGPLNGSGDSTPENPNG